MYPEGSPPLLHAGTDGSTPFRLNLHVGDVGHTLMLGPTGAGKSTALALIAAQFRRYAGATVFAFDKGNSLEALTRAVGGRHYNIAGDADDSDLCFSPLAQREFRSEAFPRSRPLPVYGRAERKSPRRGRKERSDWRTA